MDVSIEGAPVIGPDGGAGGMEGYLGAAALAKKYGKDFFKDFTQIKATDPAIKALVRAIRIGHAIYCPDHVGMVGGIGIRLGHVVEDLYRMTNDHLTKIAKPGWTLAIGEHDHHAAVGAAKMALASWEAGRPRGDREPEIRDPKSEGISESMTNARNPKEDLRVFSRL